MFTRREKMVPFSPMVDESTEKKSDVRCGMLVPVRFFDSAIDRSVTRLLDLRKVHTEAPHFTDTITAFSMSLTLSLSAAPTVMIFYSRHHSPRSEGDHERLCPLR